MATTTITATTTTSTAIIEATAPVEVERASVRVTHVTEKHLMRDEQQLHEQQKTNENENHEDNRAATSATASSPVATLSNSTEDKQLEFLLQQGYTRGLAKAVQNSKRFFAKRIWIVDNSGSMRIQDGKRIVEEDKHKNSSNCPPADAHIDIDIDNDADAEAKANIDGGAVGRTTGNNIPHDKQQSEFNTTTKTDSNSNIHQKEVKMEQCQRWEELQQCVAYHIQMAAVLETTTCFRLLNDPDSYASFHENDKDEEAILRRQMIVAEHAGSATHDAITATTFDIDNQIVKESQQALEWIDKIIPGGNTHIREHILEIQKEVKAMQRQLLADNQRVAIILATDGLPTDERGQDGDEQAEELVESLQLLEGLPVWVIIRLCTDDEDVVDFYNGLDWRLEDVPMDVLDDYFEEAQEVYEHNPWLNYSLVLHRMREMGFHDNVFDALDERPLRTDEFKEFCLLLFGQENFDAIPDPAEDWKGFEEAASRLMELEDATWNPITKKVEPWINMEKLHEIQANRPSCTVM